MFDVKREEMGRGKEINLFRKDYFYCFFRHRFCSKILKNFRRYTESRVFLHRRGIQPGMSQRSKKYVRIGKPI